MTREQATSNGEQPRADRQGEEKADGERCPGRVREEVGRGKGEAPRRPPPSIDNYSFRRVARRGQIQILKRRPERRPRREVSRPEEIRNLGCRFAVRCRPSGHSVGGVGTGGGGRAEALMYARQELPPSDNCPMWRIASSSWQRALVTSQCF